MVRKGRYQRYIGRRERYREDEQAVSIRSCQRLPTQSSIRGGEGGMTSYSLLGNIRQPVCQFNIPDYAAASMHSCGRSVYAVICTLGLYKIQPMWTYFGSCLQNFSYFYNRRNGSINSPARYINKKVDIRDTGAGK